MVHVVKISVIGAGSIVWSMVLVKDISLTESLEGSTVSFMDTDRERLRVVYGLAKRYASEVKARLKLEKTLKRKESLEDADFVFDTVLAGGHDCYEKQRAVAEKHGYYRGIDSVDLNMVSDYPTMGGYNQLKLFLDIATDVQDTCPDAWLIQGANPLFEGCNLMTRETKVKTIGLCHGHFGYRRMAETLGLDVKDVSVESVGFNHCIWMTSFRYKGEDARPLLDDWIKTKADAFWKTWLPLYYESEMSPAAVDMYKRFGSFPIGDTTRSGGWKYHTNLETKKKWYGTWGGFDSELGWAQYQEDLRKLKKKMFDLFNNLSIPVTSEFKPVLSGEQHVAIVDCIVGKKKGEFQVNIPNGGAIDGLPHDVVVEIPIVLDGDKIQRKQIGSLPKRLILHVINPRMQRMEWALDGMHEGGRDLLVEWLLNDPRTKSSEQAESTVDEILALPFNREMAKHYR